MQRWLDINNIKLWGHQAEAINSIREGNNTVTVTAQTINSGTPKRIRLGLSYSTGNKNGYMDVNYDNSTDTYNTNLQPSTLTIPENTVMLIAVSPLIPILAMWIKKRKERLAYA